MPHPPRNTPLPLLPHVLPEKDIIEAMRTLPGYLPITPSDFGELYTIVHGMVLKRLTTTISASDIMRAPVLSLPENALVAEAIRLFAEKGYSGAPIVDVQGRICGVLSEKDILHSLNRPNFVRSMQLLVDERIDTEALNTARQQPVRNVMSCPAIFVNETDVLATVVHIFDEKAIHRLPVVNSAGVPVGMITRTDLFATLANLLQ